MTPSKSDFVALCIRSGLAVAYFRNGKPVLTIRHPFGREERVDVLLSHLLDWTDFAGLWDSPEIVVERTEHSRNLADEALREALPRSIDPCVPIHEVSTGEWKRVAGGPFVTRHDVFAAARLRWKSLEIRDVESAVACFVGAAFILRSGLQDQ